MIKLGQTTTGTSHNVRYLWLIKNKALKKYTNKIYVVMAFNGNGWYEMYSGTLKECREFMGSETVIQIQEERT